MTTDKNTDIDNRGGAGARHASSALLIAMCSAAVLAGCASMGGLSGQAATPPGMQTYAPPVVSGVSSITGTIIAINRGRAPARDPQLVAKCMSVLDGSPSLGKGLLDDTLSGAADSVMGDIPFVGGSAAGNVAQNVINGARANGSDLLQSAANGEYQKAADGAVPSKSDCEQIVRSYDDQPYSGYDVMYRYDGRLYHAFDATKPVGPTITVPVSQG